MIKEIKIQLVYPPNIDFNSMELIKNYFAPLGLLSIATYLSSKMPSVEVEILDGSILTLGEIEKRLGAEIVGISTNSFNYPSALKIAQAAKEKGAKVVLGGVHASFLPVNILKNRECLDAIVVGDGEESMVDYVQGKPFSEIKNLVYRDKEKKIRMNAVSNVDLSNLPIIERKFLDQSLYFEAFQKDYPNLPYKKPIAIYSQKGCPWRDKTGGCVFCGRMDKGFRMRNPKQVWEEIEYLVNSYEVDLVWDVADCFTTSKDWLSAFLASKPKHLNPLFMVFARADELDEERVKILKEINCYRVILGVESGDENVLKKSQKGTTLQQILSSAKLLRKFRINTWFTYVLGLPGESEKSLKNTYNLAKFLSSLENAEALTASILIPLPGSKAFVLMLEIPELAEKYLGSDFFDLEELQKDWVRYFCQVDFTCLKEFQQKMLLLTPNATSLI
jgi:radical SAM superfamily enzyme YgiQ (UPF0313 family)